MCPRIVCRAAGGRAGWLVTGRLLFRDECRGDRMQCPMSDGSRRVSTQQTSLLLAASSSSSSLSSSSSYLLRWRAGQRSREVSRRDRVGHAARCCGRPAHSPSLFQDDLPLVVLQVHGLHRRLRAGPLLLAVRITWNQIRFNYVEKVKASQFRQQETL